MFHIVWGILFAFWSSIFSFCRLCDPTMSNLGSLGPWVSNDSSALVQRVTLRALSKEANEANCYTVIHLLLLHLLRFSGHKEWLRRCGKVIPQELIKGMALWSLRQYLAQEFENTPASTLDSLVWGLWCHMSMKSCEPKAANHWLLQMAKVIWVGTLWLSCDGKLQTSVDPRSVFCLMCAPDPHFASETCICLSCRSLLCFGWAMIRAQGSNIWIKQHNGESPSLPNQAWDGNAPTVSLHGQSTGNNSHIHRCICICICLYLCIWICLSIYLSIHPLIHKILAYPTYASSRGIAKNTWLQQVSVSVHIQ